MKDELEKNKRNYRTLGDVSKVITTYRKEGVVIATH